MSGKQNNAQVQLQARELKQRVLTCLHKLSDRDTYTSASSELETMVKSLSSDTLPMYLSAVSATDAADKSPVKKQCLKLITILSQYHGNSLAPHLSKLLSAITRRLRDSDSNVRGGCVNATAAIAANLSKPPFSLVIKPFLESLFTEQEVNAQMGAAMCLAAAVDSAEEPDVAALRKVMPRFEKLLRCESFKAKAALLGLIGSVISVGGAGNVKNLVGCLMEFVGSQDWAARKAAAEALGRLAVVEREALPEFKLSCLKTFEAKRYDKVKAVRETMNQTVEAWKEISDLSDEVSMPPDSHSSSKEIASDGRYPPDGKTAHHGASQMRKKSDLTGKATAARKNILPDSTAKKTGLAMFRKLDHKKPSDKSIDHDHAAAYSPAELIVSEDYIRGRYESQLEKGANDWKRPTKPETRRALFQKTSDENFQTFGVVPCNDNRSESIVSNEVDDCSKKPRESEDLTLIRQQLVQIENQQSSLLDLLQRFMGRSENGMQSLESRVHGLEVALDEISYDLAVSTGRMSNNISSGTLCCKLPGTDFFSSKFFKRTEVLPSTTRSHGTGRTPHVAPQNLAQTEDSEAVKFQTRRYQIQRGHEIIMNPLAKIPSNSQGIPEASSSRVSTL